MFTPAECESAGRIFISPLARRLAEEHNIDYRQLHGTGPNGRIIKMDVEAALQQAPAVAAPAVLTLAAFTMEPAARGHRCRRGGRDPADRYAPHHCETSDPEYAERAAFLCDQRHRYGQTGELRQQINEYAANDPILSKSVSMI